jgi:hypothetical protein
LKVGGGEWEEEDMRGQRPSGEDYENLGRKHYFERRTVFPGLDIFLVGEFGWIVTGVH